MWRFDVKWWLLVISPNSLRSDSSWSIAVLTDILIHMMPMPSVSSRFSVFAIRREAVPLFLPSLHGQMHLHWCPPSPLKRTVCMLRRDGRGGITVALRENSSDLLNQYYNHVEAYSHSWLAGQKRFHWYRSNSLFAFYFASLFSALYAPFVTLAHCNLLHWSHLHR